MKGESKNVIVTGGAGFIGSNLVELLVSKGNDVTVIDNLSTGEGDRFIRHLIDNKEIKFVKGDIAKTENLKVFEGKDMVVHLAANSDVRHGFENPEVDYRNNILGTFNILEAMRKYDVKELLFSSSSTVYGEAKQLPTQEEYGPLLPISSYGASKLASEAMISAYANYYGIRSSIFRFANVVGRNSTHGIIYDFINKLKKNPRRLEILGDGTQRKSYIHVSDCIGAMLFAHEKTKTVDIYNLGNEGTTSVMEIADIVIEKMHLGNVEKILVKTEDERGGGWKGDVKIAELSIKKLLSLGWKNKYSSREAVEKAVDEVLLQMGKA